MKHRYLTRILDGLLTGTAVDQESQLWLSPYDEATFQLLRNPYKGVAGVLYVLSLYLQRGIGLVQHRDQALKALDWLLYHHPTEDDQMAGLFSGEAGVAVTVVELRTAGVIDPEEPWLMEYLHQAVAPEPSWPDLSHGAAGQGVAALKLAREVSPDFLRYARRCAEYLMERQEPDGSWVTGEEGSDPPGLRYLGFAHGVAGMVYFMAEYSHQTADRDAQTSAIKGTRWLWGNRLSATTERGAVLNWRYAVDHPRITNYWCHGGLGVSLAFMAMYRATGDHSYLKYAEQTLDRPLVPHLIDDLGVCHGLTGYGQVLLDMYWLTGHTRYRRQSLDVWRWLNLLSRFDEANGYTWLTATRKKPVPTASLMVGNGGIAHFALRLMTDRQGSLSFPLLL